MDPEDSLASKLLKISLILLLVIGGGTLGYTLIEGWNFFDSFYMLIITITTTGYREIHPLSPAGRIFSVFMMFGGIGFFFYALNVIVPSLVESRIKRWKRMLDRANDHFVICGYGDVGTELAQELEASVGKDRIAIIDPSSDRVTLARENGFAALQGDATTEEGLKKAKIEKARGLIATMEDSENAFSIMVAKDLHPDIFTVAVSHTKAGYKQLKRAGADQILSPFSDTAKKIRVLLNNPVAAELSQIITEIEEGGMLQKVSVNATKQIGKTIGEINLRRETGAMVLAVKREGKVLTPKPDLRLQEGDHLFMLGEEDQLKQASEFLNISSTA